MSSPVVFKRHILSDRVQIFDTPIEGATLLDMVVALDLKIPLDMLHIAVDGDTIPREWWSKVRPKAGPVVHISVVPQASSTFRLVASLAVIAAATAAGGPVAGAFFGGSPVAASLTTAGLSFIGILAVNALFGPDGNSDSEDEDTTANTFTLNASTNTVRKYQPCRKVLGRRLIVPDYCAQPFISREGDDEYFYAIYEFGYAELFVKEIKSGDTLLSELDEVEINVIRSATDGSQLELYTKETSQISVGTILTYNTDVIRTASDSGNAVTLDFYLPALFEITGSGDTGTTSVDVSVYLRENGTSQWIPYTNYDQVKFSGDSVRTAKEITVTLSGANNVILTNTRRRVSQDQYEGTAVEGIEAGTTTLLASSVPETINAGSRFKISGNLYRVANAVSKGSNKTIALTEPLKNDVVFDRQKYSYSGGSRPTIAPLGTTKNIRITEDFIATFSIRNNTYSPVNVTLRIARLPRRVYDVRVVRRNKNASDDSRDDITWRFMRVSKNSSPINFKTPRTIMEMRARATKRINGSLDRISAICTSRVYKWDEVANDFVLGASRNPAWLVLDVLTGTATKRPMERTDPRINIQSFVDFANHCDRTSQEGDQYHLYDGIFSDASTARDAINSILSSCRASLSTFDGQYSIISDQNLSTPVQQFSPHNVISFSGNKVYPDVPHALRVEFDDEDADYVTQERVVYRDGYTEANATLFEPVRFLGVCRATEAWRNGRYLLAQGILRPEEFTVKVDLENLLCTKGSFIRLSHYTAALGGQSARIEQVTGNPATEVVLSESYIISGGETAIVEIRTVLGKVEQSAVTAGGDDYTFTLNQPIADVLVNDVCVIGPIATVTGDYLVKEITYVDGNFNAEMVLVPLANDIHNADIGSIPAYDPIISKDVARDLPDPVEGLTAELQFFNNDLGDTELSILIWWAAPNNTNVSSYNIFERVDDNYRFLANVEETSFRVTLDTGLSVPFVRGNQVLFYIQSLNSLNEAAPVENSANLLFTLDIDTTPPGNVPWIQGQMSDVTLEISYGRVFDDDMYYYELRWSPFFPSQKTILWDETLFLEAEEHPGSAKFVVPPRGGTYLIKAVDFSDNYSELAAIYTATTPQLGGYQQYAVVDESGTWQGVKENLEPYTDDLVVGADPSVPTQFASKAYYYFDTNIDLGDIFIVRLDTELEAYAIRGDVTGTDPVIVPGSDIIFDVQYVTTDAALENQYVIPGVAGEPSNQVRAYIETSYVDDYTSMAEWTTLASVDPIGVTTGDFTDWKLVENAVYTGAIFNFRIVVENGDPNNSVIITHAKITMDAIAELANGYDTANINDPATTINFPFTFLVLPVVTLTFDNNNNNISYVVSNLTTSGFDIEFSGPQSQSLAYSWTAQGFGRKHTEVL